MADDQEFAAVGADEVVPELIVKEGEDIDYRVVLGFYLVADLGGNPLGSNHLENGAPNNLLLARSRVRCSYVFRCAHCRCSSILLILVRIAISRSPLFMRTNVPFAQRL